MSAGGERARLSLLSPAALVLAPRCLLAEPPDRLGDGEADRRSDEDGRLRWELRAGPELEAQLAGIAGLRVVSRGARTRVSAPWSALDVLEAVDAPASLGLLAACARAAAAPPERPQIMGVVNVTPDSFSDGGRFAAPEAALAQALRLLEEGADWIDVGGESTRPGADPVPAGEELARVLPLLDALHEAGLGPRVSIDTRRARVAEAALDRGARLVNDVTAGQHDHELLELAAERGAFLALMHMRGTPRTMQRAPRYDDVVEQITEFLRERAAAAVEAGVAPQSLVLDPGLGFGKTLEHNLALLARLGELRSLGCPLLVGASRKRFIGALTDVETPTERLPGSLAAATAAVLGGATILRAHDVREHVQALAVAGAIADAGRRPRAAEESGTQVS